MPLTVVSLSGCTIRSERIGRRSCIMCGRLRLAGGRAFGSVHSKLISTSDSSDVHEIQLCKKRVRTAGIHA